MKEIIQCNSKGDGEVLTSVQYAMLSILDDEISH